MSKKQDTTIARLQMGARCNQQDKVYTIMQIICKSRATQEKSKMNCNLVFVYKYAFPKRSAFAQNLHADESPTIVINVFIGYEGCSILILPL